MENTFFNFFYNFVAILEFIYYNVKEILICKILIQTKDGANNGINVI